MQIPKGTIDDSTREIIVNVTKNAKKFFIPINNYCLLIEEFLKNKQTKEVRFCTYKRASIVKTFISVLFTSLNITYVKARINLNIDKD